MVRARWVALFVLIGLAYLPRLDRVCGLFSDDAWYVLLARALATGKGYTLTNVPTPGVVPVYPPAFPLLLSLVFRVAPRFPENVLLLKAVSVLSMAAVAVLTVRYCRRDQGFSFSAAWLIALATAVHPAFVFLATSTVMSECVFTLLELAAVVVVENALRDGRASTAVRGGVIASLAFLTRGVGIAAVFAGFIRLLIGRRRRAALAFVLAATLVAAPWLLYSRGHAATPAMRAEVNNGVVEPYSVQFWHRVAGVPRLGTVTARDLPGRAAWNAWMIARSSVGALHVYFPFRSLEPAAWRDAPAWARGLAVIFSAVVLLGFSATVRERITAAEILVPASLAIALVWPFPPTRYVLPLLPFALCYTARGVAALARLLTGRERAGVAPALLCGLAAISMITNGIYATALHGPPPNRPRWNRIFEERLDLIRWLAARVPAGQIIATQDPAALHLYAGFETVGFVETAGAFDEWRRFGVRFFAETRYRPGTDTAGREIDPALAAFTPVYRTPTLGFRVLDLGRLYVSRGR